MTTTRLVAGLVLFAALSTAGAANIVLMQHKPVAPVATTSASRTEPREADGDAAARPEIRQGVVRELYTRGYLAGAEGDLGPFVVESAILAFERDQGLPSTAEPSEAVLQALILGTAGNGPDAAGTITGAGVGTSGAPRPGVQRLEAAIAARLDKLGYAAKGDLASAIRRFERDYRLAETGLIAPTLVHAVNRASAAKGLATGR